mgnify:CR=1 FL=1
MASSFRSLLTAAIFLLLTGIHAIAQEKDIVETANETGFFSTLVAAVQAAGLVETLEGDGPFTLFAPTDEAFSALPEGTVEDLLRPENRDQLIAILTYHVVPGRVMSGDLGNGTFVGPVQGAQFNTQPDGTLQVDGANIVRADIEASNGVIHVIDSVILPASSGVPVGPDICDEFAWLEHCGGDGEKDSHDEDRKEDSQ